MAQGAEKVSVCSAATKMRAQVLTTFNQEYVFREDLPTTSALRPDDIVVRVTAASYCHTDTVYAAGGMSPATLPRIGCHEFAGEVHSHGLAVSAALKKKLPIGVKVGVPVRAYHPCGSCFECQDSTREPLGYSVFCKLAGRVGISVDGGFQEFVSVDPMQVEVIPAPLTELETAPLMCAGLTVFAALQRAHQECDATGRCCDSVGILGAGGGLGHLGVQFAAKMFSGNIIAIDMADGPLEILQNVRSRMPELDRERIKIVDSRIVQEKNIADTDSPGDLARSGNESGLDAVIILPESQAAFDLGMQLLRDRGICVIVSFPEQGFFLNPNDLIFRDIKVVGSLVGTNAQLVSMMELAASSGIRACTRVYALENLNQLVKDYCSGVGGKFVIKI